MTDPMTREQIEALVGHTPGPWEKMLGTYGRNKVCATYGCINGLASLFTIADVNVPDESERGYTDDAFNPDVAAANTALIAAAPALRTTCLALMDEVERLRAALLENLRPIHRKVYERVKSGSSTRRDFTPAENKAAHELADLRLLALDGGATSSRGPFNQAAQDTATWVLWEDLHPALQEQKP